MVVEGRLHFEWEQKEDDIRMNTPIDATSTIQRWRRRWSNPIDFNCQWLGR